MIENNRNNEQIYGRNDMIMLDPNNKIYGSLGLADNYVMKTEEGTRLVLNNPKLGSFGDVLTEFNMYGRSEQKQYKGINLLPPNIKYQEFVEVSIPKGTKVFAIADGMSFPGGNFRFFNADKTENMWFGLDKGATVLTSTLKIDAKYVQNLLSDSKDLSKICLGIGSEPIYEPYTGGISSPSPEYPQEIKSVVNPTIKLLGSNILKMTDGEYQKNGVTIAVSNGVVKLKGTADDKLNIVLANNIIFKEGTKIIFSPNRVKGMEEPDGAHLDLTNNTTKGFSINSNSINIPYIIKKEDAKHSFNVYIKIPAGTNFDEIWKPQILIGETITAFEPYTEQTITLPITLNAIPVSSGGNVTIDGQQYIADYVDVGHEKLVKTVYEYVFSGEERWRVAGDGAKYIERSITGNNGIMGSNKYKKCLCSCLIAGTMYETRNGENHISVQVYSDEGIVYNNRVWVSHDVVTSKLVGEKVFLALAVPKEIYLTHEEIRKFKELVTYYPVTIVENNYNTWMKATYKSIESV
jgi:hypothetical protein